MCFVHEVDKICVSWWLEQHEEVGLTMSGEAWAGGAGSTTLHSSCVCTLTRLPAWEIPIWEWVSRKWLGCLPGTLFRHLLSAHCLHLIWGWWYLLCRPLVMLQSMLCGFTSILDLSITNSTVRNRLHTIACSGYDNKSITGLKWQKGLAQNSRARNLKPRSGRHWWGIFLSCELLPLHLFA